MKRITCPGGHRKKAWRLKKKYKKWFSFEIQKIVKDVITELPANYFDNMWSGQTYDACRIYK